MFTLDRNDTNYVFSQGKFDETRQSDHDEYLKNIDQDFDAGHGTVTVKSIEKDPDLSMANSTIHKDYDLSLDGDENLAIGITSSSRNRKASFEEKEFSKSVATNVPPPLAEIYIKKTHDYGYGYYLKPLWSLEDKPNIPTIDRLERVRKLIDEGRKRRKRKELAKLVTNAMAH